MEHILNTENFILKLNPKVFKSDMALPNNTIMETFVQSDGFIASTTMDIDIKELAIFSTDLCRIYETLSGEARIEERYGLHMYILFTGDGRGHIAIKGYLHKGNRTGNEQTIEFENSVDQTCLKDFCFDLHKSYNKFLHY